MQSFATYLLQSSAISGLMMAYYFLALHGRRMHVFNRFFLLGTILLSLSLPLLHVQWNTTVVSRNPVLVKLPEVLPHGGEEEIQEAASPATPSTQTWPLAVYSLIALALAGAAIANFVPIYRIRRNNAAVQSGGYKLVMTDSPMAPFSLFSTVYWREGMDINSASGKLVLAHELSHIRQMHSLDKVLVHAVASACWLNPFFWLLRRELNLLHEYLADQDAIQDNDTASFSVMLLGTYYKSALPVMINPFFSPVKKRITMLQQKSKTKFRKLRMGLVVPLVLLPALVFSIKINVSDGPVLRCDQPMTLVLDAGHGGDDAGTITPAGFQEKDINLKICRELARQAEAHNIKAVFTRNSDNYLPLKERVRKANNWPSGVFVSIHVNKSSDQQTGNETKAGTHIIPHLASNGIEVIVCNRQKVFAQSKRLAATVTGALANTGRATTVSERGLVVLADNQHPAVLIECGNVDNPTDMAAITNEASLRQMCREILNGVAMFGRQ